ncbi:uncharacterized protein BDV17DRAFT_294083 [Aspergillus undulatus]|uniref:uncharacterized protein n=1 Tax=Aspergillus undulatus TaxID=1810928 RepID=UPI003CCD35D1
MEDPMMDAFLGWGTGEAEFPEFFDFELLDSIVSYPTQSPQAPLSPILSFQDPVPSVEDIPELIPDQPASQDAVSCLDRLVGDLTNRVAALESQLQSETRKREALECYIEELQPFLEWIIRRGES